MKLDIDMTQRTCPLCRGSGIYAEKKCRGCNGTGVFTQFYWGTGIREYPLYDIKCVRVHENRDNAWLDITILSSILEKLVNVDNDTNFIKTIEATKTETELIAIRMLAFKIVDRLKEINMDFAEYMLLWEQINDVILLKTDMEAWEKRREKRYQL